MQLHTLFEGSHVYELHHHANDHSASLIHPQKQGNPRDSFQVCKTNGPHMGLGSHTPNGSLERLSQRMVKPDLSESWLHSDRKVCRF